MAARIGKAQNGPRRSSRNLSRMALRETRPRMCGAEARFAINSIAASNRFEMAACLDGFLQHLWRRRALSEQHELVDRFFETSPAYGLRSFAI